MFIKNRRGFTLIELLAVIAILSILITLAVPAILRIFGETKEKAFLVQVQELYKSAEKEIMHKQISNSSNGIARFYSKDNSNTLDLNGIDYCIKISNNKIVSMAVTNANYWYYNDNISSISDISLNNPDEFGIGYKSISCSLTGDTTLVDGGLERLFTYTVSNNQVTITGYNIGAATFTVSDLEKCQNKIVETINENANNNKVEYPTDNVVNFCSNSVYSDDKNPGMTMEKFILFDVIKPSDYDKCGLNVTEVKRNPTDIVIPSTIQGKPVVEMNNTAFRRDGLTSVVIPSSITTISNYAFAYNQLASVTIPNSVTTINKGAFEYNKLTSIMIPNSVTTIGQSAFTHNKLTSIVIPNSIASIEGSTFAYNNLTSVTIPNSVTSIGNYAFRSNQLTSVTIPNSVTSIDDNAFKSNQLTSATIPNSVTSIGDYAFAYNKLTSVTIKGKSSSGDFTGGYGTDIWGWASGYSNSNITWEGSGS